MNRLAASSLAISIVGLIAALPAGATPVSYSAGLANPGATLDFTGATIGSDVSSFYAAKGITFGGLFASNSAGTQASSVPPAAANYNSDFSVVNATFTISFATPETDAEFFLYTDGFGATITSSKNGVTVEQTTAGQYASNGNDYFGFTGSSFDKITVVVSGDNSATIDNLELGALPTPVPEPTSSAILLAGLGGVALARRRRAVLSRAV